VLKPEPIGDPFDERFGLLRRVAQGSIKLSGDVGGASVLILGVGLAGMTAALK
jgi:hypothetical protein